jgi:hypothetical protein
MLVFVKFTEPRTTDFERSASNGTDKVQLLGGVPWPISTLVSTSGFQSEEKGAIPLWATLFDKSSSSGILSLGLAHEVIQRWLNRIPG